MDVFCTVYVFFEKIGLILIKILGSTVSSAKFSGCLFLSFKSLLEAVRHNADCRDCLSLAG